MAIEHSIITDPDIHEPKGVSTASDNTTYVADGLGSGTWKEPEPKGAGSASSGDVYVSNGAGSGSWQAIPGAGAYGAMNITNNAATIAITAATDATLHTDSDFIKVTTNLAGSSLKNVTFASNQLTVNIKGIYLIDSWLSVKSDVNNTFVGVKYAVNNTPPYVARTPINHLTSMGNVRPISGNGITATLNAGDNIALYIAANKTCNITVVDMNTVITLLEEIA